MRRGGVLTAFAVCGSVIGAGFASGREIGSFFARFGVYSPAAMASAVSVIGLICHGMLAHPGDGGMPRAWRGTHLEACWRAMFALLMTVTGGAMLSGSGEIAALMLPVHGAQAIGMAFTLALGVLLTVKNKNVLPAVSVALTVCLLGMMALGLCLEPSPDMYLSHAHRMPEAFASGICYGGLNAALALPAMAGGIPDRRQRRRTVWIVCALLGTLLFLGNALLLRHPGLINAPMPLVRLLGGYGIGGYRLCGATLYLALLTTLLASLKGLWTLCRGRAAVFSAGALAVAIIALLGFTRIVDVVYPFLGAGCFVLMAFAIVRGRVEESAVNAGG